jgi:hypothetical protein
MGGLVAQLCARFYRNRGGGVVAQSILQWAAKNGRTGRGYYHGIRCDGNSVTKISVAWVREQTMPTKRRPIVGEFGANFCV